ncbi:MAG: alpha/beta hydrolase [Chloroflexi bacterium]|nr:alpha/beta hydrolase [Chloroflexota bacterium]
MSERKDATQWTRDGRQIVLVHGAWADGSSWGDVIPALQEAGYTVTAVQLSLRSLTDDVTATRHVLDLHSGPTVLVGHSYGGSVITAAAAGYSQVVALVYISAFAPDAGQSTFDLVQAAPATPGSQAGRPDGNGFLWFDRHLFPTVFAGNVDARRARVRATVQKPIALAALGERLADAAWRDRPCWYLLSADDQVIAPSAQREWADRIQAQVREVASSRASLVSHARETADLIMEAARAPVRA